MISVIQILGILSGAILALLLIGVIWFIIIVIFIMTVHIFTGFIHKDMVPKVCISVIKRIIDPTDFQLRALPKLVEDEIERSVGKKRFKK